MRTFTKTYTTHIDMQGFIIIQWTPLILDITLFKPDVNFEVERSDMSKCIMRKSLPMTYRKCRPTKATMEELKTIVESLTKKEGEENTTDTRGGRRERGGSGGRGNQKKIV